MALGSRTTSGHTRRELEEDFLVPARGNEEEAFPRISETETPELDALSSESESDQIPVSLSKRAGKIPRAQVKRLRKAEQQEKSSQQSAIPSLRPAQDIMNRIRHDPTLEVSDHVVGYEDRHVGIMWKGVEEWLSTIEEEDFIPLHRIQYFKRKSDDHVVWDREKRIDEIFGSGVSGMPGASDEA
ncbi:MAG: hypothetical protein L6R40_001085 [Gallowayella cf. fulva]|nr:MAG: hypothetical protein L6R40_001085 [Xanthomendoza cf. fulva]